MLLILLGIWWAAWRSHIFALIRLFGFAAISDMSHLGGEPFGSVIARL